MRTWGREPALAAGGRRLQHPDQQGQVTALMGDVATVRHPSDEDVGLVAVIHVRRDEIQPTEGRLVLLHTPLPAAPIERL
eukprot:8007225-Alexandrium_andersonii.AAC.1